MRRKTKNFNFDEDDFLSMGKDELKEKLKPMLKVARDRARRLKEFESIFKSTSPALIDYREYGNLNLRNKNLNQYRNIYKNVRNFLLNPYSTVSGWKEKREENLQNLQKILDDNSITHKQSNDFFDFLNDIKNDLSERTIEGTEIKSNLTNLYEVLTFDNSTARYKEVWQEIYNVMHDDNIEDKLSYLYDKLNKIYNGNKK